MPAILDNEKQTRAFRDKLPLRGRFEGESIIKATFSWKINIRA